MTRVDGYPATCRCLPPDAAACRGAVPRATRAVLLARGVCRAESIQVSSTVKVSSGTYDGAGQERTELEEAGQDRAKPDEARRVRARRD